jgi:hypothetical protein
LLAKGRDPLGARKVARVRFLESGVDLGDLPLVVVDEIADGLGGKEGPAPLVAAASGSRRSLTSSPRRTVIVVDTAGLVAFCCTHTIADDYKCAPPQRRRSCLQP